MCAARHPAYKIPWGPWAAVELGLWLAKLAFGSEMHMAGAEPVSYTHLAVRQHPRHLFRGSVKPVAEPQFGTI